MKRATTLPIAKGPNAKDEPPNETKTPEKIETPIDEPPEDDVEIIISEKNGPRHQIWKTIKNNKVKITERYITKDIKAQPTPQNPSGETPQTDTADADHKTLLDRLVKLGNSLKAEDDGTPGKIDKFMEENEMARVLVEAGVKVVLTKAVNEEQRKSIAKALKNIEKRKPMWKTWVPGAASKEISTVIQGLHRSMTL